MHSFTRTEVFVLIEIYVITGLKSLSHVCLWAYCDLDSKDCERQM